MTATPEQKRCLAMAATDADGTLIWEIGGWRRPHHPSDRLIPTTIVEQCRKAGWLTASPRRHLGKIIFAVRITQAGAQEALRS